MRTPFASAALVLGLLVLADPAAAQWGRPPPPSPPSPPSTRPSGAPAPLIGFALPIAGFAAAAVWFIRRRGRQQ